MVVDAADGRGKLSEYTVIMRMLHYYSVSGTISEIMFYSSMDSSRPQNITESCIRRDLVKLVYLGPG